MRDVKNIDVLETKRTYIAGTLTSTSTVTRKALRSQRDDSHPTLPKGGVYWQATPYSAYFYRSQANPGFVEWKQRSVSTAPFVTRREEWTGWSDAGLSTYGLAAGTFEPFIPTSLVSAARNRAIERLRNTDLNMAQTIGEIRESVATVESLVKDAVSLLKRVRTPSKSVGEAARRWSREYLRFIYGVKPIMSDIYAVCEEVNKGLNEPEIGFVKVDMTDDSYTLPQPTGTPGTSGYRTYEGSVKRGIEVAYYFKVSNPEMFQLWKFGLTNPASLAWELLPFSFVVDWFTGLGSFIGALDIGLAINVDTGYETRYLKNNFTVVEVQKTPSSNLVVLNDAGARCPVTLTAMKRLTYVSFPPPPLPYLDVGLNLSRFTALIALFAQADTRYR